jgi:hypothetical protein
MGKVHFLHLKHKTVGRNNKANIHTPAAIQIQVSARERYKSVMAALSCGWNASPQKMKAKEDGRPRDTFG